MSGSLRWILGACLVLSVLLLVFEGSGQLGAMGKPTKRGGSQKRKKADSANLKSANGNSPTPSVRQIFPTAADR
jgi:hypothetical protein